MTSSASSKKAFISCGFGRGPGKSLRVRLIEFDSGIAVYLDHAEFLAVYFWIAVSVRTRQAAVVPLTVLRDHDERRCERAKPR